MRIPFGHKLIGFHFCGGQGLLRGGQAGGGVKSNTQRAQDLYPSLAESPFPLFRYAAVNEIFTPPGCFRRETRRKTGSEMGVLLDFVDGPPITGGLLPITARTKNRCKGISRASYGI